MQGLFCVQEKERQDALKRGLMILPNRSSMNGNTTKIACNKMTKKFIDIMLKSQPCHK